MNLKQLESFINKRKISFIGSIDENGFPNIKAMLKPRQHNGLKEFYFSTNTSALRTGQYLRNPHASIYFYRKGLIKYEAAARYYASSRRRSSISASRSPGTSSISTLMHPAIGIAMIAPIRPNTFIPIIIATSTTVAGRFNALP